MITGHGRVAAGERSAVTASGRAGCGCSANHRGAGFITCVQGSGGTDADGWIYCRWCWVTGRRGEVMCMAVTEHLDRFQQKHRWAGFPLALAYKYFDDFGTYLAALVGQHAVLGFPAVEELGQRFGAQLAGRGLGQPGGDRLACLGGSGPDGVAEVWRPQRVLLSPVVTAGPVAAGGTLPGEAPAITAAADRHDKAHRHSGKNPAGREAGAAWRSSAKSTSV
jgi:hypothetical protein